MGKNIRIGWLLCGSWLLAGTLCAQSLQWDMVAVGDSGCVTLGWFWRSAPASGNSCVLYYAARREGPYAPVDTLAASATGTTHRKAGAAAGARHYYLAAGGWRSDTITTLYMGMENIGGGVANLAWNNPLQHINNSLLYKLYRRGVGKDSVVSTTANSYRDTVTVCGDTLEYVLAVELLLAHPGPRPGYSPSLKFVSPVCRDYFSDFTAPDTARLDSVSLVPERNRCDMGWQPSKSKDVFGYIVYIYEDGIWKVMDTLHGASNTFYADTLHADGSVHEYRIASLDTCRNASPLGEIHHTMVLSAAPNKCDSVVSLSWNAYAHMPGGAASFEVFARSGKDGFQCIGSGGKGSSFRCEGLDVMRPYTFYVRVWNADRTISATSSMVEVDFHRKPGHGTAYIRSVSVSEDNELEIMAFVNDTVDYRHLILQRLSSHSGPVVWADTLQKNGDTYRWRQSGLDVTAFHYYRLQLTDECDFPFFATPEVSNLVLSLEEASMDENRLSWSSYDGFGRQPDSYRLFRSSASQSAFSLLDELQPSTLRYSDPLAGLSAEEFLYRVSATGGHAELPFQEECFSNTVSVSQQPTAYIPNSFIPESEIVENRVFKPVLQYVDEEGYLLTIFDRWGQVVFETNRPDEGWDGTIKGLPARMGVYVYQLTYRLNDKKSTTRRGMVNLIR
ncbi:MAG: gliding motility-associated C-terminal domain-containing protein [Bacteroidales bacterium]|nr:gliding motility-associated C-terminal domain-containing protein [Bacteroidales bacterium]